MTANEYENRIEQLENEVAQLKASLDSNKLFFQEFIDGIPLPIYYKRAKGNLAWFNQKFVELTELTKEKIAEKQEQDILDLLKFQIVGKPFISEKKKSITYEGLMCCCEDLARDVIFHKSRLSNNDEAITIIDSTNYKQVEQNLCESEENLHILFNNMMNAASYLKVITDDNNQPLDLTFLRVNQQLERNLNINREQIIGQRLSLIYPALIKAKSNMVRLLGNVAITGVSIKFDISMDEQWFTISCYSTKKGYCVMVLDEITDQKFMEKRIKSTMRKLAWSNTELEQFAYIASHDLQEPLRKVQAFGDRLASKYADRLDDKGRDYLDRMQNAAKRGQILINDLLAYSRVTTKAKPFVKIDLNELLKGVLSDLEIKIEKTKAQFEIQTLPTIDADETQMNQLFTNLINNALKFQKENETPLVKIYCQSSSEANTIYVQDNGIGFEEQYIERIFQPFQRLHGTNEYEGSGIGLAICRKIGERHNGSVTAQSKLGEGSTFIIHLPIQEGV